MLPARSAKYQDGVANPPLLRKPIAARRDIHIATFVAAFATATSLSPGTARTDLRMLSTTTIGGFMGAKATYVGIGGRVFGIERGP
jgi:hypothetical protein